MSSDEQNMSSDDEVHQDDEEWTCQQPTVAKSMYDLERKKFTSSEGKISTFHLQAQRKKETNNKVHNPKGIFKMSPNSRSNEQFTCFICKKDFPSDKSLHGHMRCHPNRNWRGVHPPRTSSSTDHKHSSCSALFVKEKKLYSRQEDIIAAKILVSMSHDMWPAHGVYPNPKLSQVGHHMKNVKGAFNIGMNNIGDIPSTSGVKDHEFDEIEMLGNNSNKKRRPTLTLKFKLPYPRGKDDQARNHGYQCDICRKSFPTFQALGGHRSSHNKERNNNRPSRDTGESGQLGKRIIDFDLNDLPNGAEDEAN